MRSQDVFDAARNISNRFLLCQVVSANVRHLHTTPRHYSETIHQSLKLVADSAQDEKLLLETAINEGRKVLRRIRRDEPAADDGPEAPPGDAAAAPPF